MYAALLSTQHLGCCIAVVMSMLPLTFCCTIVFRASIPEALWDQSVTPASDPKSKDFVRVDPKVQAPQYLVS